MTKFTERSLLEQLGLGGKEIQRRLHLLNITHEDKMRLNAASPIVKESLDSIVGEFYKAQVKDEAIASIIGDIDTLNRLHDMMKQYILSLFEAEYNESYINSRLRIGKVHKRSGVRPALYMRSQDMLRELIENVLVKGQKNATETIETFRKYLLFDTELIFESYVDSFVSDVENARQEVDRFTHKLGISINHFSTNNIAFYSKDSLTGLFNRHWFYEYLERECAHARRYSLPLVLIYFDLNKLKYVNDSFGHLAGDDVLKLVGTTVLDVVRAVDIPARYGGDEFCIIMPRTTLNQVTRPINEINRLFSKRCQHPVTFSIGVIQTGPDTVLEPDELVRYADKAMYQAKSRC